ncbi:alpha/beta fold hydrolase [Streptomyces capillispiralis]|uniref:alpha/beta fold hydrolase n=1 Tax=Streptomyces capillispiralis TaxID=68182 RepID=UPI0036C96599
MNRRTHIVSGIAATLAVAAGTATAATASTDDRTGAGERHSGPRPTVVLVHGAFEDASTFDGITRRLHSEGYRVVSPATPLRGLEEDTRYISEVVRSLDGPVVLAGHSYGGMLISEVAAQVPQVKALVYASAFIPQAGESLQDLNYKYPGSLLGPDTTYTVNHTAGPDLHVRAESFREVFAADRPARDAALAAAHQRPVAASALSDKARHTAPDSIPSYAVVATEDKAIPPAAQLFMAKRADARTWKVKSAHDLTVTHPELIASVIDKAARTSR